MEPNVSAHTGPGAVLSEFADIYAAREKAVLKWITAGKRAVGCLGEDVPEEILIAGGFIPIRVVGDAGAATPRADNYLENAFNPVIRSQFERLIDGTYAFLDRLIVSNSSDILIRLFYYIRQIRRTEEDVPLPPVSFFDFKFSRFRSSTLYNRDRVRELIESVEKWSGRAVEKESLSGAAALCDRNRRLMRELLSCRKSGTVRLSGTQALKAMCSSWFIPKEEHTRLLERCLRGMDAAPAISGKRLFVAGSAHEDAGFYELVESCGAVIVGENHDCGSRLFIGPEVTCDDHIAGITDFYHLRESGPKKGQVSERAESLVRQVRETGSEGVIFFIRRSDDAESWEYPVLRDALNGIGVPSLLLTGQPYRIEDPEGLRERVKEFVRTAIR